MTCIVKEVKSVTVLLFLLKLRLKKKFHKFENFKQQIEF